MAEYRRRVSSLGGTRAASAKKNKVTLDQLNDIAQDSQRLPTFASSPRLSSKSAKFFESESHDAKKESTKQAWAPKTKHKLFSSSSRFQGSKTPQLELGLETTTKPHKDNNFGRAEDHIYLGDLFKLREKFEEADKDGNGTIDMEDFLRTFDKLFRLDGKNEEEIVTFFNKIDYKCDGCIDWDEFCTYMYLEFQERNDVVNNSKKVEFKFPAEVIKQNPHKSSVCRLSHLTDGSMVSCSLDGVVCFWSHDYKPKRTRKTENGLTGKPKWITDMALCIPQTKILLTTGDHEIQFYEMMNFEPYCQLRKLDAVPLRVTFWSNPQNNDECLILIGDNEGTVTVIKINNIQEAFKYWKHGSKTEGGMPTYSMEKLIAERIAGTKIYRWKLHSNWVSEIRYFPSLHNFVSCSCDPLSSVVMGSPSGSTPIDALLQNSSFFSGPERGDEIAQTQSVTTRQKSVLIAKNRFAGDQRVFRVPKGASTFDYCPKNNVLVTGGLDHLIRLWNPFINSKPVTVLTGQCSPLFSVWVDSKEDRLYSIGNDNIVKVWHMLDYSCLYTVIASAHKLSTELQYFYFNPLHCTLVIATDQLGLLRMIYSEKIRTDIVQSHLEPITAIKYSHCFDQVVTSCEGALVKVWDITSGLSTFEFSADMGKNVGISTMDVDKSGKRIATCGENGKIKLWNYNNGQCIRILDKGNSLETTDIKFITLNDNKYIITVGWDRKIHLYPDIPARHVQHILKPIPDWSNASSHGHNEDILCISVGAPNLMATSSFDGDVIVWSVVSCHMLAKLKVSFSTPTRTGHLNHEDRAVHKVLFLDRRAHLCKTAATLVASGPCGKVHFWNVYDEVSPIGSFRASKSSCISDMVTDDTNSLLITADVEGFIGIFNIKNYCVNLGKDQPKKIILWRAHTQRISSILFVHRWNTLVTGSLDGSVRLWTLEGQYIGTFGQHQSWNLGDPSTYQHPSVPRDIFMDQQSLTTMMKRSGLSAKPEKGLVQQDMSKMIIDPVSSISDNGTERKEEYMLQSHISVEPLPSCSSTKVGKRLRHLRTHSAIRRDESKAKTIYGNLPYQPLSDDSICYQPPCDMQRPKTTAGMFRQPNNNL